MFSVHVLSSVFVSAVNKFVDKTSCCYGNNVAKGAKARGARSCECIGRCLKMKVHVEMCMLPRSWSHFTYCAMYKYIFYIFKLLLSF